MTKEARIQARIDADLKEKVGVILDKIGLSQSDLITMTYKQVAMVGGLPFPARIPNQETVAAITEDVSAAQRYESADALFADLERESDS